MAEVGLALSILGVVQLAGKVTGVAFAYFADVKDAPKQKAEILAQLSGLTTVLNAVLEHAGNGTRTLENLTINDGPLNTCIEVLESLQAMLQQKSGITGVYSRLTWPLKEDKVSQYISRIQDLKRTLSLALSVEQLAVSKEIRKTTQKTEKYVHFAASGIERIEISLKSTNLGIRNAEEAQRVKEQQDALVAKEETRTMALEWLHSGDFKARHKQISGTRQKNTGEWLLNRPEIMEWTKLETPCKLLWGYGIAGAGKTVLSSVVINHVQPNPNDPTPKNGVAHIYFDYNEWDNQKPIQVLSSLVMQLASQLLDLPTKIEKLYEQFKRNKQRPTIDELYAALLELSKSFNQVFLIFDALDECHKSTQRVELLRLFQLMAKEGIWVFITSRPHPQDIEYALRNAAKIELSAQKEDIEIYIREKIENSARAKGLVQIDHIEMIISGLVESAKGMFLIVQFHLDYLCQQTTTRQILDTLDDLKSSSTALFRQLYVAYGRALKSISNQSSPSEQILGLNTLRFLVKAGRTISIQELQIALSIKPNSHSLDILALPPLETLIDVCAGLVTVDGQTIRLTHYTVQEFLLKEFDAQESLTKATGTSSIDLEWATVCVTYLSFDTLAQGACTTEQAMKERLDSHGFLDYAACHLGFHLKKCESLSTDMLLKFIKHPGSISSWHQFLSYSNRESKTGLKYLEKSLRQPLHAASVLGHLTLTRQLLLDGADISIAENDGNTALYLAAEAGSIAVVKLLLENSASVAIRNINGNTALLAASEKGHVQIVELLLDNGGEIMDGDKNGDTALHKSSIDGHLQVVKLLLDRSADIETKSTLGCTALLHAASRGHEAVVKLLLSREADITSKCTDGYTALLYAAAGGHEAVLELLLNNGADITAENIHGDTALQKSAEGGYEAVVGLLLQKRVKTSNKNNNGRTALHAAAQHGHEEVVRLLKQATDIDNTCQSNAGETALYLAAQGGYERIVGLLLDNETNINTPNSNGQSPLHAAATFGHEATVKLLLNKGANTYTKTRAGNTALYLAATGGHERIVELLVDNGAEINAPNSYDTLPLHGAAYWGHENVVQLLLDRGANTAIQDEQGNTALHDAAWNGREVVVELLLRRIDNTVINSQSNDGSTPLKLAANEAHVKVVQLLLERGANIRTQDKQGDTALHEAARLGYEVVVELLVRGMDNTTINSQNNGGSTPLKLAANKGHEKVVELLLDSGAEIDTPSDFGNSPLHGAASSGHELVVQLLLDRGANTAAQDKQGDTALHNAARLGHKMVVELLVREMNNTTINSQNNGGSTPLNLAAIKGHEKVVELLLNSGAEIDTPNNNGNSPLHEAASSGHRLVVELLLDRGANTGMQDKQGDTALHDAAFHGHELIVAQLLESGANMSVRNNSGYTALHLASENGRESVTRVLLARGAEAGIQNGDINTSFHLAAIRGHETVIDLLLDNDADINTHNSDGDTALIVASQSGSQRMIQILLDRGSDISNNDNRGNTVLHRAVEGQQEPIFKLLLEKAANTQIDLQNNDGKTVLHLAAETGVEEMVRLLLERGVDMAILDNSGQTAFHIAVDNGWKNVINLLHDWRPKLHAFGPEESPASKIVQACRVPGVEQDLAVPVTAAMDSHENSQQSQDIAQTSGSVRVWGEFTQGIVIGASFTGLVGVFTYFLCFHLFNGFFYDREL